MVEQSTERAIGPVVEQSTERAISPVIEQSTERAISPVVEQSTERAISPVVEQSTERAISPVIEQSTDGTALRLLLMVNGYGIIIDCFHWDDVINRNLCLITEYSQILTDVTDNLSN